MKVTLYGKEDCPPCIAIREYLNERGIQFEDVKVSEEWQERIDVIEISGQGGIPVVVVDEHVIIGFQPWRMDEYLSK